jgi:DNA-3-methyladenine glycosylase I
MSRVELTVPVDVNVPAAALWDAVTDWPGQGEWMLGTRIEMDGPGDGRHLGATFRAFTGLGPLGVWDPMEIVEWDPPKRCVVRHTGRVVRGDGVFEVVELGPARSRFLWSSCSTCPSAPSGARVAAGAAGVPRRGGALPAHDGPAGGAAVPGRYADVTGADRVRCGWAGSAPEYVAYHDDEWGRPLRGEAAMFERLSLEGFQSGLSWIVVLRKRPAFRAAFAGFDPVAVAAFGEADVERLLADAGIVRNRRKIEATVANARAVLELDRPLDELLWSFAPSATSGRPRSPTCRRRARGPWRWRRSSSGAGCGSWARRRATR